MKNKKSAKKEEQLVLVNEFGIPLFINKKNPSQLKDRIKLLKTVVSSRKPIGERKKLSDKEFKRAKMHLGWYEKELKALKVS